MLIVLVVFVPLLLGLPIFHMGFALSTIQVSERYKLFLTLFFWIGLPVFLVDLMWVIQRIKQRKGFLSYMESACVLLPYLVIGYFIFINLYKKTTLKVAYFVYGRSFRIGNSHFSNGSLSASFLPKHCRTSVRLSFV